MISTTESLVSPGEAISTAGQAHAYTALYDHEENLLTPPKKTGLAAYDRSQLHLYEADLQIVNALEGTDYTYFGHLTQCEYLFYDALIEGYGVPNDLRSNDDFMWREVQNLDQEYPEVYDALTSYTWSRESKLPVNPDFAGAFVLPRMLVRQTVGSLYDQGRLNREIWGYPNLDDPIPKLPYTEDHNRISERQGE